jgi:hypothetical protein
MMTMTTISPPPPPFLPVSELWSAWGLDHPFSDCVLAEDGDEILQDLMLRAQAGRKRPWRMQAEFYDADERLRVGNLLVEFDAHSDMMMKKIPRRALMSIECVVMMGRMFFWLELPGISAFCGTQEETLGAIDAIVPFVPETIRHFFNCEDRLALEVHLWQCIHLLSSGSDRVREAAVRRKMRMMGFFVVEG